MDCKVCGGGLETYDDSTATGVCADCRTKLGIAPMPPSRRRPRPCAHCQGLVFIRVVPREFSASGSDFVKPEVAPMTAVALPSTSSRMLFAGKKVKAATVHAGAGKLEMYICSTCGFVEWHCQDPESIPIGTEYMTEVVDFSPGSPYRG
jgi:hypothetical protein